MRNLQGNLANSTIASDIALLLSSTSSRFVSSQKPSSSDTSESNALLVSTPSGTNGVLRRPIIYPLSILLYAAINEYYLPLVICLARK